MMSTMKMARKQDTMMMAVDVVDGESSREIRDCSAR
jgi:hypothetical protein